MAAPPPPQPPPLLQVPPAYALSQNQSGNIGNGTTSTNGNGTLAPSHAWFVPGYVATMAGAVGSSGGNGTRGASEMRPQVGPGANGTGFFMEEEATEGFSDFQTVVLACLATLAPLVALVIGVIAFRIVWKYLKRRAKSENYDGVLDSSCDNMEKPLHSHLLNCDKKCSEAHLDIDGEEPCDESSSNTSQMVKGNNHSSTNGSIITMTLKNNHLIVETEERNDLEEDTRETTMKYSPNARDGVFVVEVQQGVRRSPPVSSVAICTSSKATTSTTMDSYVSDQKQKQQALIHKPPDRFSEESSDTAYTDAQSQHSTTKSPSLTTVSFTGLCQSNQSLSAADVHYSYGNQEEYDNGRYGYPVHSGGSCYGVGDGGGGAGSCGGGGASRNGEGVGVVSEGDEEECGGDGCEDVKPRADSTSSSASYKPKITSAIYKNRASVDLLTDIDHSKLLHSASVVRQDTTEDLDPIQVEQNLLGNSLGGPKVEETN